MEKLEELEKGIQELANIVQKMKDTINWYEDYAKAVYANKPNIDQFACDYADEQQEQRQS